MPVILQFNYTDGSSEVERLPAEIWRLDEKEITKVFVQEKEVETIVIDPFRETADTDVENNYFPAREVPSRFELFKQHNAARGTSSGDNPMQKKKRK